jgi:hypothetical protein
MNRFLRFLVLALVVSATVVAEVSPEEKEEARQKIAHGMGVGVQNNIDLRRMLIKTQTEGRAYMEALEQFKQIVRIQTENFGEGSAEVMSAIAEGFEFAAEHGVTKAAAANALAYTPEIRHDEP